MQLVVDGRASPLLVHRSLFCPLATHAAR
jgi:hypothetical protein